MKRGKSSAQIFVNFLSKFVDIFVKVARIRDIAHALTAKSLIK